MTVMAGDWTVDELAREAGTTVRNVRVYQDRGLLAPPRRRGRVGIYDEHHLERLRLILRLLERGYPFAAIGELIDAWEQRRGLGAVLGFEEALHRPLLEEAPERYSAQDIAAMFPGDDEDGTQLRRAIEAGTVEIEGDHFVSRAPGLIRSGARLVADGIPLEVVSDIGQAIWEATTSLSAEFVDAFARWIWEPFNEAGMPDEEWPRIFDALEAERRSAIAAVTSALNEAMRQAVEAKLAELGPPGLPALESRPGVEESTRPA
jgi:DNA-binding transcriptional MerR regulator